MTKKKRKKRPNKTVVQMHHPIADNRSEDDELWTIPVKRSLHLCLWRSIQHTKNTWENLDHIKNFIDCVYFEYLRRLRELTIEEKKKEPLEKNKIRCIT